MNKINSMRAKLLHEKFGSNSAYSFSEMLNKIMEMPSFTEEECCNGSIKKYPLITLNSEIFKGDFTNLQQAIEDNFPEKSQCSKCKRLKLKRTFQPQILIEVILLLFLFFKFRFTRNIHNFFSLSRCFLGHSTKKTMERSPL